MPLVSSYTPWEHQETKGFLIFSGGIERDQGHVMGLVWTQLTYTFSNSAIETLEKDVKYVQS